MLLVVAAVAYYYAGGYAAKVSAMKTEAVSMVSHSSKDTFRKSQTSIAYDINGKTLSVLKGEKDVYYIEYEDIPIYVKQAIISTEDKRFYKHNGIDYRGIMRAAVAMIQDGEVTGTSEYYVTEDGGKQVTEGYACILTEHFHQSFYVVIQLYSVAVLMYHKSLKLEYLRVVEIYF